MANYTEKPKKKRASASRDIAVDKLDFYNEPAPRKKRTENSDTGDKIKGRPKSGWQKFCLAAFPNAEDTGMERLRKIVLIASVVVFVATIAVAIITLTRADNDNKAASEMAAAVGSPFGTMDMVIDNTSPDFGIGNYLGEPDESQPQVEETEEVDVTPLTNTPLDIDWNTLYSYAGRPSDVRGWIKITGTMVNNVVMQSSNNDYYLDHNIGGADSLSGEIFSSYKNKWNGKDDNIILYGHNMIGGGYFAYISHYVPNDKKKEPLAFYKVHPTIMLATPGEGCQTYKIFAGVLANTQPQYGEVFDYAHKTSFKNKTDFNNFIIDIMDRSWFFTDVDLEYGDQLLTLSTCCWPLGKDVDTRWVIFARKVRPGESEYVDTSLVERNKNAKLFDRFYQVAGGSWVGSTWDRSKLKSWG